MNATTRDQEAALWTDANSCLLNYGTKFNPDIIVRTHDIFVYTASGRKILDWTSGQMSCLIGHGHPEIVETIREHAANLDHLFSGMLSPPVIKLAKALTDVLPNGLDRALFLSTGGESNEAAIRLAKLYTGKFEIVAASSSWHGMTAAAVGAQYLSGRAGYGPNMPGNHPLPAPNAYRSVFRHSDGTHDWQTELDYGWSLVDAASCGSLAAVILEPIQSSGGMHCLPPGYLKAMKVHCEARGMLLIIDEAQTALGRAGDMFAFEHKGVVPDILTLSKTLGNGLPLSAVVTSHEIERVCRERNFLFYTTHVSDPLPAAVGLKVLEIVQRDGLVARSRVAGARLHAGLRRLQSRYGCIGDVRGRGLMAGIEIVADRATKTPAPELGSRISDKMVELGLSANLATISSFTGVFRIAPPITITDEQLDMGLAVMEEAFNAVEGSQPLYSTRVVERAFGDTATLSSHHL
ncbi:dialkylglycine decarboxylase [Cryomyces antarcticus]